MQEMASSLSRHCHQKLSLCGKQATSLQVASSQCIACRQKKGTRCVSHTTIKFSPRRDGSMLVILLKEIRFTCCTVRVVSVRPEMLTWVWCLDGSSVTAIS